MDYLRQLDIFDPKNFVWPVNIIGLGGIGSAVSLALVKLGVSELRLWDNDVLEEHNIPNQLIYRMNDAGQSKIAATTELLKSHNKELRIREMGVFDSASAIDGLVVSAVHSMEKDAEGREGRIGIWKAVKNNPKNNSMVPLYLDGRLGGEILELFTIRPFILKDIEIYEQSLFPDSEAAQLPCTARAVIHPALVIAGLVAAQITRWSRKERYFKKMTFDLKTMTFLQYFPSIEPAEPAGLPRTFAK